MFLEVKSNFTKDSTFDEEKFVDYCDRQFAIPNLYKAIGCLWYSVEEQRRMQDQGTMSVPKNSAPAAGAM
jgi:hypothetical protein